MKIRMSSSPASHKYYSLILELKIQTSGVHFEPSNIVLKNVSAIWNFCGSPINVLGHDI